MASQKQARSGAGSGGRGGAARTGSADAGAVGAAKGSPAKGSPAKGNAAKGNAAKTGAAKTGAARDRATRGSAARGSAARGGGAAASSGAAGRARPGAQAAVNQQAKAAPPARGLGWLQITTLVLSLCGLAVSIYLTIAHLHGAGILACPDKGFINCEAVTTSPESRLFGIFPVAELGLAFYVFMVAINSPWAWRSKLPQIYWARLGSVVIGMIFVLWLLYSELVLIKNLCLWCTTVHVITFLLFTLLVFHATGRSAPTAANQASQQRG
jgi:uncharacterized membrane protein